VTTVCAFIKLAGIIAKGLNNRGPSTRACLVAIVEGFRL
jgi:hypothetical protein